ncbi:SRCR-like domain-containing protein, partial [Baffinella frigidus]
MCSRETLRLVNDTLSSGPALVNDTLVYGPPAAVSCANAGVSLADIRLVACRPQSSGSDVCCCRVEIKHDNAWGTVCDDSFDENDAAVACRQAGCATGPSVQQFGGGSGNIWLDNMACSGSEATLGECGHNPWGMSIAPH